MPQMKSQNQKLILPEINYRESWHKKEAPGFPAFTTSQEIKILRNLPAIKKASWYLDSWVRHKRMTEVQA